MVASLLIQNKQHSFERGALIRERQSHIYEIVKSDPQLYWRITGGAGVGEERIKRQIFAVEYLQYVALAYESDFYTEQNLREEVFVGFFQMSENRQFWKMTRDHWSTQVSVKKRKRFMSIAGQELTKAEALGPGDASSELQHPCARTAKRCIVAGLMTASLITGGLAFRSWFCEDHSRRRNTKQTRGFPRKPDYSTTVEHAKRRRKNSRQLAGPAGSPRLGSR